METEKKAKYKKGVEAEKFERRTPRKKTKLTKRGKEIVDGTPLQPPLGYKKQESLHEQIRRMVVSEQLRLAAEQAGMETFEEADDFDVGDDLDPTSPFEEVFEGVGMVSREDPMEARLEAVLTKHGIIPGSNPANPSVEGQAVGAPAATSPPPQQQPEGPPQAAPPTPQRPAGRSIFTRPGS